MIQRSLFAILALCALLLTDGPAVAQQAAPPVTAPAPSAAPKSFLPPAARSAGAPAPAAAAPPSGIYAWITARQAEINQRLAQAVRDIRTRNPVMATLALALLSFAYGVLHAAGPGHGKAVISSYVLANGQTVRRGIQISFLAAFFQALSALILVGILVIAFQATGLAVKSAEAWLETISWGLVTLVGAWLLWSQFRKLRPASAAVSRHPPSHPHEHALHDHDHGHVRHGHSHKHDHQLPHGHHHHADDGHDHSECCGHAHMPDPKQLEGAWSWSKAISLALAVGVRPCTGAILVLIFALSQGLLWAGVFATFAMAIGTAITVSALAALAVGSRELAARYGSGGSLWAERVRIAAGVAGSVAVLLLGLTLFIGSLSQTGVF